MTLIQRYEILKDFKPYTDYMRLVGKLLGVKNNSNAKQEAWEMTPHELYADRSLEMESGVNFVNDKPRFWHTLKVPYSDDKGNTYKNFSIERSSQGTVARNFDIIHKKIIESAIDDGKPVPAEVLKYYPELREKAVPVKEDWQMTQAEYLKSHIDNETTDAMKDSIAKSHELSIIQALKENKKVPDKVLKDYPVLKEVVNKIFPIIDGNSNTFIPEIKENPLTSKQKKEILGRWTTLIQNEQNKYINSEALLMEACADIISGFNQIFDLESNDNHKQYIRDDFYKMFLESELPKKIWNKKQQLDIRRMKMAFEFDPKPIKPRKRDLKGVDLFKEFVSQDEMRPQMQYVWHNKDREEFVATDAFRLVRAKDSYKDFAQDVKRYKAKNSVAYAPNYSSFNFIPEGKEERFPPYESVMPKDFKNADEYYISEIDVEQTLGKVLGVVRAGRFTDMLSSCIILKHKDMSGLEFNADYLADAFQVFYDLGIKKVNISINKDDSKKPVMFYVPGDDGIEVLLMPMYNFEYIYTEIKIN